MAPETITRRILFAAGIAGAVGVIMGSFGAHGLDSFLDSRGLDAELIQKRLGQFDVAVRYHLIHSVALLGLAGVAIGSSTIRKSIFVLFLSGLVLFSGSLYVLVLTNTPALGAITPLGGLCWIVGWLMIPLMARRTPSQ